MSSRAEEKERRRQERLAAEQAAARAATRRRTLQIGVAAAVGLVVVVIVVVVALAGGGSGGGDPKALAADASAAGCTLRTFPSEGRTHTTGKVTYKTNPPTSGNHNPTPAPDGIYAPGNEPAKENWVHTLEHGRILLQYRPGASAADVQKLRNLAAEKLHGTVGYHVLVFRNNTNMPAHFAAVAWTHSLTCPALTPKALDAMRQFRATYTDKAPELIA
jgi:hypothetical protein